MENPDIIQLGSLIRDSSELGFSSFTSQTGLDIGDAPLAKQGYASSYEAQREAQDRKFKKGMAIGLAMGFGVGICVGIVIMIGVRRK